MAQELTGRHPALVSLIEGLTAALRTRLRSVVLYGSAARGDQRSRSSDMNLLVVADRLDTETLDAMRPALEAWTRARQPLPRFFIPQLIAESADVFPIEFHDIRSHGVILHGEDPLVGISLRRDHLRLQFEREMREKLMRLREGYLQTQLRPAALTSLMVASWGSFIALFRGCLHLLDTPVPLHDGDVVTAFCGRTGVDAAPFQEVERLREGGRAGDPRSLFVRYHRAIEEAVHRVNRIEDQSGGGS
jgi:predicted nucleotidyltransferase